MLTHGHEDHIGALPYLLRDLELDVPVHGPPYALGLVQERLREADLGFASRVCTRRGRGRASRSDRSRSRRSASPTRSPTRRAWCCACRRRHDRAHRRLQDRRRPARRRELRRRAAAAGRRRGRAAAARATRPTPRCDGCAGGERPVVAALETRIAQAEGPRGRVHVRLERPEVGGRARDRAQARPPRAAARTLAADPRAPGAGAQGAARRHSDCSCPSRRPPTVPRRQAARDRHRLAGRSDRRAAPARARVSTARSRSKRATR